MELVVTEVEGGVDWLERLEIDRNLLLFVLIREDSTTVDYETEFGYAVVKLETLLCRFDGGKDRETVHTRFNILCCTELITKHLLGASDVILWWEDEGNHRGTVSAERRTGESELDEEKRGETG